MSRNFKNIMRLYEGAAGKERRRNLMKEILKDSTPIPEPVVYEDIDRAFREWVEESLDLSVDGERVPTVSLFSNQRFSEYMQSWENVDDRRNLKPNFKIVTRENNPKKGTLNGGTMNIPGEYRILLRRVESRDRNNRRYYTEYWMKQPLLVDMVYTVSIVVSKYSVLNDFNMMMNDRFKAINCYIRPKGHFMPMEMTDVSDESNYSIDNRQYYSQSYTITVRAYIIPEDSYTVRESPHFKLVGFEGEGRGSATIEEIPSCGEDTRYEYDDVVLRIDFPACVSSYRFRSDMDFVIDGIDDDPERTFNLKYYRFFINDVETGISEGTLIREGDEIRFRGVVKWNPFEAAALTILGHSRTEVHEK